MKKLYRFGLAASLIYLASSFFLNNSFAQTHTPRFISMTPNTGGFYEYLPQGYNPNGSQTYPLIIFAHGLGECGDGSSSQLPMVLRNGLPRVINNGQFPVSFTVNGQSFKYIVISPQFIDWPGAYDIENILDYVIAHYKVNVNRMYVTGLSMGGGATWDYAGDNDEFASRIAAIVPVCGASWPEYSRARVIADADLAVWATHNNGDPTVPVFYTNDYITQINLAPSPMPLAKKTIFPSNSHNAWSTTYDPNFKENNMNIYEWMLQYQRNAFVTLPVTLVNYRAYLSGPSQVMISWTTSSEFNNDHFRLERSNDGINFNSMAIIPGTNTNTNHSYSYADNDPMPGNNFYRLSQTDLDGRTSYYGILMVKTGSKKSQQLIISPNPASDRIVLQLTDEETGPFEVQLSDMSGKIIRTWKFDKQVYQWQQSLNLDAIRSGTYIISVTSKIFKGSQPFIKN